MDAKMSIMSTSPATSEYQGNRYQGQYNVPVFPAPGPGCGRCPTCGRGGYVAPYPYYVPYYIPAYPTIPFPVGIYY